ncbi:substrate-binding periplasmic protein [Litchfieldella qijiaojingensis]|uniref:substrate-binding periplasmic protein n=1 Tax=Litchfieldella qijiaojingensis TaxID=980347 RepID=UPI00167247C0|nr:transporter substrate-binding domain-containing protein [Halomonas qijiaojingensis]
MKKSSWLACCLLVATTASADLNGLTYITEEYPPYNFKRNGEVQGISVDVLTAIFEATDSDLSHDDIRILPWARGYDTALKEPNTVLFSTTRTTSRETLFKWVGPIVRDRVTLLARRDRNIDIASIEDLNRSNYQVAVIREDIGAQRLLESGVDQEKILSAISNVSAMKMLNRGRVDLWAYSEDVAFWLMEENGLNNDDFESIYTLSESYLYFALHRDTEDRLVDAMQAALDRLREQGVIEVISEHR